MRHEMARGISEDATIVGRGGVAERVVDRIR